MNLFLSLLLALLLSPLALAQEEPSTSKAKKTEAAVKNKAKSKATSGHYPIYGQLVSLTSKTLTIRSSEDKPERKFTVSKETEIHKDGKPATAEDAKEGQWVGGYVSKSDTGQDRLLKLNLSAKAKGAKSKASKKPASSAKG